MSKSTAVANVLNDDTLAILQDSFPVDRNANRILLPRLGMVSQDKTEETGTGKNKKFKLIAAAGEFFIERQGDEEDPKTGKKMWIRTDIGNMIEGVIVFQRKQLRMYDESTEQYTSSPIYDTDDEIIPLWTDKTEVARGTPAELKAKYMFVDKRDGKEKSKLEDNRILYVLYEGEVFQMTLRGSSMYSFLTYARKTLPPSVITVFSSEPKEKGTIAWNQMTFTPKRKLTQKEAEDIVAKVTDIKEAIRLEKSQFTSANTSKPDNDLVRFSEDLNKAAE